MPEFSASAGVRRGPVGIVATSPAAVHEVICLLARDHVGVSHVAGLTPAASEQGEGGRLRAGLHALHADPSTQVIVVVSAALSTLAMERALSAVGQSDKPVIACFLGANRRDIWRSGAIPAARLDEVGMRAAAWARGWDQALISSRLLEQDEQLGSQARELAACLHPARHRLVALFDDAVFCDEARLMLAELGRLSLDPVACVQSSAAGWEQGLRQALADGKVAVVLLGLWLQGSRSPDRLSPVLDTLHAAGPGGTAAGPQVIAHVSCAELGELTEAEQKLRAAGATLLPGSAAAARLAALVVSAPRA